MRVLLDTNVLIAAFITRGVCSELLEHCLRQHVLITSEYILGELSRHLLNKFKYSQEDAEEAVALLRIKAQLAEPVELAKPVSRDPDDDIVLATAKVGNAECIVTGDKTCLRAKSTKQLIFCALWNFLPMKRRDDTRSHK